MNNCERCGKDHRACICKKTGLLPNPKQAYGDLKVPLGFVPSTAVILMGEAFKEGARKYGAYNWRQQPVESMTYLHATLRHVAAYIDGEEIDPESGNPHLAHALACLAILVDAAAVGCLLDNRPPHGVAGELLRAKATASTPPIAADKVVTAEATERWIDSLTEADRVVFSRLRQSGRY